MSIGSHIMLPMSIEATQIFHALDQNAARWRQAIDLQDDVRNYIKNGPTRPTTYIPPPATQTTGRNVNVMA